MKLNFVQKTGDLFMFNLQVFYEWFHQYYHKFYSSDPVIMRMVQYKEQHSERVARNSKELAEGIGLTAAEVSFAELIGLLHDVARAEQAQCKTFKDSPAFDHGDVGVLRLQNEGVLNKLSSQQQETVLFCVKYHNKRLVPAANPEKTLFAKIVRDADKLDIFRCLPTITTEQDYSPILVEFLKKGRIAPYEEAKTLADKRLIRLGWFYDINYSWTLKKLIEEGYADELLDSLPESTAFLEIRRVLREYLAGFHESHDNIKQIRV